MTYFDFKCPYCGAELIIDTDDGKGSEEDVVYTQECNECGKTFAYTATIRYRYDVMQAPCQNGDDHKMKQICSSSSHIVSECEYCGMRKID